MTIELFRLPSLRGTSLEGHPVEGGKFPARLLTVTVKRRSNVKKIHLSNCDLENLVIKYYRPLADRHCGRLSSSEGVVEE